jgi:magnesium-transporting ATPase (P-type)
MGNFFLVHINYLAVVLSAVSSMIIGFLWYGPIFGKTWAKMVGMTADKMEKTKKDMPKTYGIMFTASLLMAYVLAHLVWYAAPGSLTIFISVKTAVWAWLGFVATTMLTRFLFNPEKKPVRLLVIDSGYYLVNLIVMGVIFGVLL